MMTMLLQLSSARTLPCSKIVIVLLHECITIPYNMSQFTASPFLDHGSSLSGERESFWGDARTDTIELRVCRTANAMLDPISPTLRGWLF